MIEIVNEQSNFDIDENIHQIVIKAINQTMECEGINIPFEVSVVITDNIGIKSINKKYRKIDNDTDVLSFPLIEGVDRIKNFEDEENVNPETGEVMLGDIILSIEKALHQANEYDHSPMREIAFLIVHSSLHLLGYDHIKENDRKKMRDREERILSMIGLTR
jgi:probable rRNA maturation factor